MNFYVCSTVRHLLFSVLKSTSENNELHTIFMITDQQRIESSSFNCSILPDNVNVLFISRKEIRDSLYSGIKGKLIKAMANVNIKTSPLIREKLSEIIFSKTLKLPLRTNDITQGSLFLFNDRNKISRLFRLAFKEYNLIEEGFANYYSIRLKKYELKLKKIGFPIKYRYFGSDSRCININLLNPADAPDKLKNKIQPINFINSSLITNYCFPFFKLDIAKNFTAIIATQPQQNSTIHYLAYGEIIKQLTEKNIACILKPHPSEDMEFYKNLFPNTPVIDAKIPLELIACSCEKKCSIFSLYSTAGLGFEKYCQRLNLIKDDEQQPEILEAIINSWKENPDLIKSRVSDLIQ